jgi:hypothetical protein
MEYSHSHSLEMALPREAAWQKLRDLSVAHHYVPGLTGTEIRTALKEGVGASRRVFQGGGRWLDETVTEWAEGQGFEIRLHRAEQGMVAPFREASFRYWLEDAGPSTTRLVLTLSYSLRWGVFGALLERLAMGRGVSANLRDVALGLREYYLSGAPVTDARRAELRRTQ